jgi:hypothetical protein
MDKKYCDQERGDKPCPYVQEIIGDDPGEYKCVLINGHEDKGIINHNLVFYRHVRRTDKMEDRSCM